MPRASSGIAGGIRERGRTARQRLTAAFNQGVMPGQAKADNFMKEAERIEREGDRLKFIHENNY